MNDPTSQEHIEGYHKWYYDTEVWDHVSFLGVPCRKSVSDLWNYQEIICERKPSLIVEFGTYRGGTAVFFAQLIRAMHIKGRVITVDCKASTIHKRVMSDPLIDVVTSNSTEPAVLDRIARRRVSYPGSAFVILDSDHHMQHVLSEMIALRPLLRKGDYVVVEDGNINGHPVLPGWGEGPLEAIAEYQRQFPDDYQHDATREHKFGFTFAPQGFLIRR